MLWELHEGVYGELLFTQLPVAEKVHGNEITSGSC